MFVIINVYNYFYSFYQDLILESLSSNTKGEQSHLDCIIILEDFMSYLICDVLEIL